MRTVPTYGLYGEATASAGADLLHCETIHSRSQLHNFRISPHRHDDFFQVLFLSAGAGEVTIDGVRSTLHPPCLVLVPPVVIHGYDFSNPVEGLVVTLYQRHLETLLRASPDLLRHLSVARIVALAGSGDAADAVAEGLATLAAEHEGHAPGRATMIQARLAGALVAACRADASPLLAAGTLPRGRAHALRFRQMVDQDFRLRRPVAAYAHRLGVTEVHLRRLCRAHLGRTPLDILNARTVLEARRLLTFGAADVKQIADSLGFDDAAYFSRFFRRETGVAPSAFRAMQRTTDRLPPTAAPPPPAGRRPATARSGA